MFIIYLDDMMEAYEALSRKENPPGRQIRHGGPKAGNRKPIQEIPTEQRKTPEPAARFLKKQQQQQIDSEKRDLQYRAPQDRAQIGEILEAQQTKKSK